MVHIFNKPSHKSSVGEALLLLGMSYKFSWKTVLYFLKYKLYILDIHKSIFTFK